MPKKKLAKPETKTIQNRIVSYEMVDPRKLTPNPDNWRIHPESQRAALESVMNRLGWLDEIRVNKRSGRVVNGHLRLEIALDRKEKLVPVIYVDLSDEEEKLALVTFDSITGLAVQDTDKLLALAEATGKIIDEDKPLADLLNDLIAGAELGDSGSDSGDMSGLPRGDAVRNQVRPVLYPVQVAVFEEAIALAGGTNRGEALMMICQAYVEAKGQSNSQPEGGAQSEDAPLPA